MRNFLLILLAGGLLTACETVRYVNIETYNPAEITFPGEVANILVVNNAVPQAENEGYTYILQGERQDTCKAKADSALFDACQALGEAIVSASYFNDVLLYEKAVREDSEALVDKRLSPSQVASLCEETGANAVISIDRLLFDMEKKISPLAEGFLLGSIDVHVKGVVRSYLPDRETPLATVQMEDSLSWIESSDYLPLLNEILPSPEEALRATGKYFGAKIYSSFVPHWANETRWYFTGAGSRWKEASAYAANERWDMAEEIWMRLYQGTSNWKTRAKAASNLAFCNEMKGDLNKAYEWAHKSYELFNRNGDDKSKNAQMQKLYVQALSERIRSDKKLNLQFGD